MGPQVQQQQQQQQQREGGLHGAGELSLGCRLGPQHLPPDLPLPIGEVTFTASLPTAHTHHPQLTAFHPQAFQKSLSKRLSEEKTTPHFTPEKLTKVPPHHLISDHVQPHLTPLCVGGF